MDDVYLVHGAKNVAKIFRHPALTVNAAYSIALRYGFAMSKKAASMYTADTSGSRQEPLVGDRTKPRNRILYRTHENIFHGLLGSGLAPTCERFENHWTRALESLNVTQEWSTYPDLLEFFEDNLGTAIIEAVFGSFLLTQNQGFIRDLWAFDAVVMQLMRRVPAFWAPNAHRIRSKLLRSIKNWHQQARTSSDKDEASDMDSDKFWGCRMIKERFKMLLDVENQDYDSVASTDLAFIWA